MPTLNTDTNGTPRKHLPDTNGLSPVYDEDGKGDTNTNTLSPEPYYGDNGTETLGGANKVPNPDTDANPLEPLDSAFNPYGKPPGDTEPIGKPIELKTDSDTNVSGPKRDKEVIPKKVLTKGHAALTLKSNVDSSTDPIKGKHKK